MNPNLQALFGRLPLAEAMTRLVVTHPQANAYVELAQNAANDLGPELQAGVWLYVDELDRSHRLSQGIANETGAYWHGIMHRREGDFSNAKYWFRQVGNHPAIRLIDYDPVSFIDDCALRHPENPEDLVELQRKEWKALFDWCVEGEHE